MWYNKFIFTKSIEKSNVDITVYAPATKASN